MSLGLYMFVLVFTPNVSTEEKQACHKGFYKMFVHPENHHSLMENVVLLYKKFAVCISLN